MKFLGLAVALGTAALASVATAADIPRPVYKAPAPIAAVSTWTGFYLGVNGGVARMHGPSMSYTDLANTGNTFNSYDPSTVDASGSSALAGFHGGYNWQVAPNWVVGIEGDWDWTDLGASGTNSLIRAVEGTVLTDNVVLRTNVNWLASARGRLGYSSNNWLLYATGGVAFANVDFNAQVNCTNVQPSLCNAGPGFDQHIRTQFSDTRVGAVVGGGIEIKAAQNWVFGAEYLYYRFSDNNSAGGGWFNGLGSPAPFYECGVPGENCAKFTYGHFDIHTVRARLSYQFGY